MQVVQLLSLALPSPHLALRAVQPTPLFRPLVLPGFLVLELILASPAAAALALSQMQMLAKVVHHSGVAMQSAPLMGLDMALAVVAFSTPLLAMLASKV